MSEYGGTKRLTCLFMGLFSAALWAVPLALFRFVIFTEGQYNRAFIAVFSWCCVVNGLTLILNLADKIVACCGWSEGRVPELILHGCTLLGGGAATVFSMFFFHHKISKAPYQIKFLVVSCFSLLFVSGAYGLAYGLEWYHLSKITTTTTAPMTNFSTPNGFETTMPDNFQSTVTQPQVVTTGDGSTTLVPNFPTTNSSNLVTDFTTSVVTTNVTKFNVITDVTKTDVIAEVTTQITSTTVLGTEGSTN